MDAAERIVAAVASPEFRRATFAGEQRGRPRLPWQRVVVRPVLVRGERVVQFAYFDGRKTFTFNDDVDRRLRELTTARYGGVNLRVGTTEWNIRTTKKGTETVGESTVPDEPVELNHNRDKATRLTAANAGPLLHVLGLATADGAIKPTMRAKFVQIEEFLKHLDAAIDQANLTGPLTILDCGCGSSYLTLAAHHYLNHVANRPATLIGVDVNEALIRKSRDRAEHLDAAGIEFLAGRIGTVTTPPDVVLALHACDTATDDALAAAARMNATVILAVPCCHKAVNRQVTTVAGLSPIVRYGLLRERLADLATDAFRAQALRIAGYKVDVVEFVAPEISPKNLMIRAVKTHPPGDPVAIAEFVSLAAVLGVDPPARRIIAAISIR